MLYLRVYVEMGNKNSGERIYKINNHFFKEWTSQMAYIFGFTCADGNIHGRTLSWDLSRKFKSNQELLDSFNSAMKSTYPIQERSASYRLRISNQEILNDLRALGIVPNKRKILIYPDVPKKYLSHFIRGFLDGDGWIVNRVRENGGREVCVGFSNGSLNFMEGLISSFRSVLGMKKFNLRRRGKFMKNGKISYCYQLEFYSKSADVLLSFLYNSLNKDDLFLRRKFERFINAKKIFLEQKRVKELGRKLFEFEVRNGGDVIEMIKKYLRESNLIPREIAVEIGMSLSTLYKRMDKLGIRKLEKRGSSEWSRRIIKARKIRLKNGK